MSLHNKSPFDSKFRADRLPILCYVTDRRSVPASPQGTLLDPLLAKIEAVAKAGVDWIQLREKDLSGKDASMLTREVLRHVSKEAAHPRTGPRILVNDRLDVALAEQAGGVHLGESSFPVEEAKRLLVAEQVIQRLPRDFLVGASCHSLEAAKSAASAGANYIFFGPVFVTPSKAAYGKPQGLNRLAEICNSVAIPVLAIGGITLENIPSCLSAGASGIAAIRLFQDSANLTSVARAIRH